MTQGGDLGAALSKILDDPEAMKGIMSLAGSLMNTPSPSPTPSPSESQKPQEQDPTEPMPSIQASAVPIAARELGGADMLTSLLSVASKPSKNDPRCTLLMALKPYLNPTRRDKVDSLVKALQLASLASGFLGTKKL